MDKLQNDNLENLNSGTKSKNVLPFLAVVIIAIAIYLVYPIFEGLFSLQLRSISSIISQSILGMLNMEVQRTGTILSVGEMRFDIIPACSGSKALQVLIVTGFIWCGIQPNLGWLNKIWRMLLVIPIATICNGIRVAALVAISVTKGEIVVEGLLHSFTGLMTFAAALSIFFLLTGNKTNRNNLADESFAKTMLTYSSMLLVLAYTPFFAATLTAWKGTSYNHNDLFGQFFTIPGIALWIWYWRTRKTTFKWQGLGLSLFIILTLATTVSQLQGNNNYLLGISFIAALVILGLMYKGWIFVFRCAPLYILILCGLPKVNETINDIAGSTSLLIPLISKSALAILCLLWFSKRFSYSQESLALRKPVRGYYIAMTMFAAVILLAQLFMATSLESAQAVPISLSYLQGEDGLWEGRDAQRDGKQDYYNYPFMITRNYVKGESKVGITVIPSSGKRKNIHTPEYCQFGTGWIALAKDHVSFTIQNGQNISARRVKLENNDGVERTLIYWFSDGESHYGDYFWFVFNDTFRKFYGKQSNWMLYVVWTDDNSRIADDFLEGFRLAELEKSMLAKK